MKKWEIWKRLKLLPKSDKKQLLNILIIRLVIYCIVLVAYFNEKRIGKFEIGLIFGMIFMFAINDIIDVVKNFLNYTDRLYLELKEEK